MKRRTHLVVGRLDERGSMELMMAIGASVCFPSLLSLTLSSLALVGSHQNSVLLCLRSKVLRLRTSIPHPSAYSFTAISPSSPFSGPFLSRAWIVPFAVDNHTPLFSWTVLLGFAVACILAPQPTAILTVFTLHADSRTMSASRTETGYFLWRSAPCVALYIQLVLLLRQLIPSPCFNSGTFVIIRTIALVALCP
ncbi:hypothetical protein C8J57DRAFT_1348612 [Mycena rebaudengoi]|nr:hypothetical protein C8J57DRAFT_1348612 [Mycena rebaudengoi]